MTIVLNKIVSGGQTGADRAALDVSISFAFPHGGWVPEGRVAEDGLIPAIYCLKELAGKGYAERTGKNVIDSDGTVIFYHRALAGGSALTHEYAIQHKKPCLCLDLDIVSEDEALDLVLSWLSRNRIQVMNVAGPRASHDPEIYKAVRGVMLKLVDYVKETLINTK